MARVDAHHYVPRAVSRRLIEEGDVLVRSEKFGEYPFGLTAADERRAAELHTESVIVDMLFMGPCGRRTYTAAMVRELQEDWSRNPDYWRAFSLASLQPTRMAIRGEPTDFRDCWEASGIVGGNREIIIDFVEASLTDSLEWTLNAIAQFDRLPWLVKALRADDFRRAKHEGKRAGYLSTQMTTSLTSERHLEYAHELGITMIQLTYNSTNLWGTGCTEHRDGGITERGANAIHKLNELGIIVDTAHCGPKTTLDACAISSQPIVASHTSAQALYNVARAKSEEELRAIAKTGGVIGIYAVPFFLASGRDVTIEAMLDHIDYVSNLVGWQHVGIGTDWPLQLPIWTLENVLKPWTFAVGFREEHNIEPTTNLIGFDDYRDFPNITRGLVQRGYGDDEIRGILGENFLRVFADVCG